MCLDGDYCKVLFMNLMEQKYKSIVESFIEICHPELSVSDDEISDIIKNLTENTEAMKMVKELTGSDNEADLRSLCEGKKILLESYRKEIYGIASMITGVSFD